MLNRAVVFHERGEIRDRSYDGQAFRASGLNLVVIAFVGATYVLDGLFDHDTVLEIEEHFTDPRLHNS
ncbi:hypothetical protein F9K91_21710 [Brucella tritici]|uniref:Uncharacterized protein n=1 Tax=Brucella tritici TaxID=94626 RepID=A0A7X6FSA9_9HYPH|nr:hypothetical protein [Brucella tritici]KAB2662693.1 hypothetical protein F9K91_21710 [Brucella tritici]NKW11077.1 hypothetical protein [Brucella tritici]